MSYLIERINKQDELIRHFKNLFGYTHSAVTKAIREIRENDTTPEGEQPTGLSAELLRRASNMEASLTAIEQEMG